MHNSIQLATDLISFKNEIGIFKEFDYFYIIKSNSINDAKLLDYEWDRDLMACHKLRGPKVGPVKIDNEYNNHQPMHGYVFFVNEADVKKFEQENLLTVIKHGHTMTKHSYLIEANEIQNNHFNSLFEQV